MIWNVLLVVSLATVVVSCWRVNVSARYHAEGWVAAGVISGIVLLLVLICSFVATGINSNDTSVYRRSGELVDLKVEQRDALSALVQDELSIEQYEAVMAATPDADILVILGNNASTFLVEKTRLLVAINTELNSLVNGLARDRINLCAWADNPLSPRLFVSPSCPAPIQLP